MVDGNCKRKKKELELLCSSRFSQKLSLKCLLLQYDLGGFIRLLVFLHADNYPLNSILPQSVVNNTQRMEMHSVSSSYESRGRCMSEDGVALSQGPSLSPTFQHATLKSRE